MGKYNYRKGGARLTPGLPLLSILLIVALLLNIIPTYALATNIENINGEEIDWDGTTVHVTITSNVPLNTSSKEDKTNPRISLRNSLMNPVSLTEKGGTETEYIYTGTLNEVWGNWDAESVIFYFPDYQQVLDVQALKVKALSINGVPVLNYYGQGHKKILA